MFFFPFALPKGVYSCRTALAPAKKRVDIEKLGNKMDDLAIYHPVQ